MFYLVRDGNLCQVEMKFLSTRWIRAGCRVRIGRWNKCSVHSFGWIVFRRCATRTHKKFVWEARNSGERKSTDCLGSMARGERSSTPPTHSAIYTRICFNLHLYWTARQGWCRWFYRYWPGSGTVLAIPSWKASTPFLRYSMPV